MIINICPLHIVSQSYKTLFYQFPLVTGYKNQTAKNSQKKFN